MNQCFRGRKSAMLCMYPWELNSLTLGYEPSPLPITPPVSPHLKGGIIQYLLCLLVINFCRELREGKDCQASLVYQEERYSKL